MEKTEQNIARLSSVSLAVRPHDTVERHARCFDMSTWQYIVRLRNQRICRTQSCRLAAEFICSVILQQIREGDRATLHREAMAGDWHPRNQAVCRIVSGEDRTYQTVNNPPQKNCVTVLEPSATCAQDLPPCVCSIPVTNWPQKACRTTSLHVESTLS